MQAAPDYFYKGRQAGDRSVVPGLALMALTITVTLIVILAVNGAFESYPFVFLVPWLVGLGILMAAPSVILYRQGRFSFADPLIFATWSYFFPAFVVGGLFLAAGWAEPWHLTLIQDANYNLPLTVVMVALAFSGLAVGYFLPIGEKVGAYFARVLPIADYSTSSFVLPGLLLHALGVMNTVAAFTLGIFGFQKTEEINSYDGLVYLTTLFWMQSSFLLWLLIFKQKRLTLAYVPVIALLLSTSLGRALFAGNRGSIILIFTIVALAYILAGRQFRAKQAAASAVILSVGIILGMIYGTTFRAVKGTESQQSASQYTDNIFLTFDQVGRTDTLETINYGFASLAERVDLLSVLAVVVSNYEQLKPYEEAYGIDNNIWVESTTFFIPRVIWTDKPVVSDPRRFSDLYFNFAESSFAITPTGDLIRNFGIAGVFFGMLLLGLIIRTFYRALVEGQTPSIWRSTLYFMLLTSISYEGFYGTILPSIVKVGFTAVIGILLVLLIAKRNEPHVSSQ